MRAFLAALLLLAVPAQAAHLPGFNLPGYSGLLFDSAVRTYQVAPTAYWDMNQKSGSTVTDVVNGHNLAITGGVTFVQPGLITNDPGTSAAWDGSTGYATASAGDSTSGGVFDIDISQSWAFEFVVNVPSSVATGSFSTCAVLSKLENSSPFTGYEIEFVYSGGLFVKAIAIDTSTNVASATSTTALTAGIHHVFVSFMGGSGSDDSFFNFTIDGVTGGSANGGTLSSSIKNSLDFTMGARADGQGDKCPLAFQRVAYWKLASPPPSYNSFDSEGGNESGAMAGRQFPQAWRGKPNIVLDDDACGDIDNAADRRIASTTFQAGTTNYLADMSDDSCTSSVTAVRAFMNYMGFATSAPKLYHYTAGGLPNLDGWDGAVTSQFNGADNPASYPDCVAGGRTLLGAQADQSVTWLVGGFMGCLDGVLTSSANANGDGLPSGVNLIKSKIAQVFVSSGLWPSNATYGQPPEFNFGANTLAASTASDVFANWPNPGPPILIYGIEQTLPIGTYTTPATGTPSASVCSNSVIDPWQFAFNNAQGAVNPCLRAAFTQPIYQFLISGFGANFRPGGIGGTGTVDSSTGANSWAFTAGPVSWIQLSAPTSSMQTTLLGLENW